MSVINFTVTDAERALILAITKRACDNFNIKDKLKLDMDITAVHCNDVKLRLQELLDADDFNFAHDIFGIQKHIDRNSGKLKDCFLPRYSR